MTSPLKLSITCGMVYLQLEFSFQIQDNIWLISLLYYRSDFALLKALLSKHPLLPAKPPANTAVSVVMATKAQGEPTFIITVTRWAIISPADNQ